MKIQSTLAEQIAIERLNAEKARIDAQLNAIADEVRNRINPPKGKKLAAEISLHYKGDHFEYDETAFEE